MEPVLIYDILTYIIVGFAVLVALKKAFHKYNAKTEESSCSDGCGGCTTKCDLKEFAAQNE